jgi:hypothetical protein
MISVFFNIKELSIKARLYIHMFVDPCIIVQFTKKIQQDATVYQNFISYLYKAQHVSSNKRPSSGA